MTELFICKKCSKDTVPSACAYTNTSTAFPYYILKQLRCPMGHKNPNWEHVEKGKGFHIPVNFKSVLSQESIKTEENRGKKSGVVK